MQQARRARAFTLVELIIVVGIVAFLIAILMPALSAANVRAKQVECATNLRTIGLGLRMYNDQWGRLPQRFVGADPENNWGYDDELIQARTCVVRNFVCPVHVNPGYYEPMWHQPSYGMNWYYDNSPMTRARTDVILVAETAGDSGTGSHRADRDGVSPGQLDATRHRLKANWLFIDGRVEWLSDMDASGIARANWGEDQGKHDGWVP
jgi:prepilin-type processing-associated H-X9-DG protein